MTTYRLISFKLCPYVQRAAIVLAEKGIAFERVDIDLDNKPDWFLQLSPLGKVPVLVVDTDGRQEVLFESAVIAEYLDETLSPRLHPADPLERARHRGWIEFASATLADLYRFYTGDRATFEAAARAVDQKLARLEAALGDGPFFAGERFGLVDAAFAPIFREFAAFDAFVDHRFLDGRPRLAAWAGALAEKPSVIGAVSADFTPALIDYIATRRGHMAQLRAPARAA
jgi:glutathione S-transferase